MIVVLDTETTGLSPLNGHRITEIGCLAIENRVILEDIFFQTYINPQREVEQEAVNITGLTNDFLSDKPLFSEIVDDLITYLQSSTALIIHNAPFDLSFLRHEFKLLGRSFEKEVESKVKIIDSLTLARNKFPGQRNSLDALVKRYNIGGFKRNKHGALLDSQILAEVYLQLTLTQESLFDSNINEPNGNELISKADKWICPDVSKVLVTKENISEHENFLKMMSSSYGGHNWK